MVSIFKNLDVNVCLFQCSCNYILTGHNCGQSNIFARVCHSVHRGFCLSAYWDSTPQWTRPPQSKHSFPHQTRHPLDQAVAPENHSPHWTRQRPDRPPGSRLWNTVNEQPVRILLECFVVAKDF